MAQVEGTATAWDRCGLLEREQQLRAFERLLDRVRVGEGSLAMVEGPAGIGKTRLLDEVRRRAAETGFRVLAGCGSELERDFPFGLCAQVLEPPLARADGSERAALLSGAARLAASVLVPGEGAQRETLSGADPAYPVLHGLYWLCANLAERGPLLLAVDDAHWGDPPSLRFLAFLAHRLEGLPALVALCARPAEPGAEQVLLRRLGHGRAAHVIRPQPLSTRAVTTLVRAQLARPVDEPLSRACHDATDGNPFLLRELLHELGNGRSAPTPELVLELGPERIAAAVLERVERLGGEALALARAVSILGDRADLQRAAELSGIDAETAAAVAGALAEAAILEVGPPLHFRHPIVRNAIHDLMPPGERTRWHHRAARLLDGHGVDPDAIAAQLLRCDPSNDAWVLRTLRGAAGAAWRRGAPEVAARYLERALAEPPTDRERGQMLIELGAAKTRAAQPDARQTLAAGLDLATEPGHQTWAAVELGQVLCYEGDMEGAAAIQLRVLERVRDDRSLARTLEMMLLTMAEIAVSARRVAGNLIERAHAAVARRDQRTPRGLRALVAFERAVACGDADGAATLAEAALADGRLLAEQADEVPHPYYASAALALADRADRAEHYMAIAIAEARKRGSVRGYALASAIRAWIRWRSGDLDAAEVDATAALGLAEEAGWNIFRPIALSARANVLVERGELHSAASVLAEWDLAPQQESDWLLAQPLRESRALLRLAQGEPAAAVTELMACAAWEEAWGADNSTWVAWRPTAARAHAALGEADPARRLADEQVEIARRFGAPGAIGVGLCTRAMVGPRAERIEVLGEAADLLARSSARLQEARALADLGAALRDVGDARKAREPLAHALQLAQQCGAGALAARARTELIALGGRPRATEPRRTAALTPSEQRVCGLARQGLTNTEVAQALFVTVKTVETHLGHAYRKLGISSRADLPEALARTGGSEPPGSTASADEAIL